MVAFLKKNNELGTPKKKWQTSQKSPSNLDLKESLGVLDKPHTRLRVGKIVPSTAGVGSCHKPTGTYLVALTEIHQRNKTRIYYDIITVGEGIFFPKVSGCDSAGGHLARHIWNGKLAKSLSESSRTFSTPQKKPSKNNLIPGIEISSHQEVVSVL